jgi:hypothetical protein
MPEDEQFSVCEDSVHGPAEPIQSKRHTLPLGRGVSVVTLGSCLGNRRVWCRSLDEKPVFAGCCSSPILADLKLIGVAGAKGTSAME